MRSIEDGSIILEESIVLNSGEFTGLTSKNAISKIAEALEKNSKGKLQTVYRLRDWLVSRQRYWGVPIPMIHCGTCGTVPVPEKDLPVRLPEDITDISQIKHGKVLEQYESFYKVKCPKCQGDAVRETDTLDTFVDSSWYFLRFLDSKNSNQIYNPYLILRWMPVDVYIGGMEHAILHLLYARFIHKFLFLHGFIPEHQEPFKQLITQGLVKGKTFKLKSNGKYTSSEEASLLPKQDYIISFEKMSKSKGNGVNPIEIAENYGSDALRLTLLFQAPSEKDISWEESSIKNMYAFIEKIWKLFDETQNMSISQEALSLRQLLQNHEGNWEIISFLEKFGKIVQDLEQSLYRKERNLHVCVARLMECFNLLKEYSSKKESLGSIYFACLRTYLIYLFPFAPNIASELWNNKSTRVPIAMTDINIWGNNEQELHHQSFPQFSPVLELIRTLKGSIYIIFINGKSRGTLNFSMQEEMDEALMINKVTAEKSYQRFIKGKTMKRLVRSPPEAVSYTHLTLPTIYSV
eukprot:TRINITY_DN8826_c0_g1_i1.p1 TRINITY_DN8826_c0_g1~~TRINITY_DN8826_c0_g1_i1.p1  ORF type:complete len:521 (-),score=51.19 TRINITY_DN8826_c0_g1_i1:35-1597(-)